MAKRSNIERMSELADKELESIIGNHIKDNNTMMDVITVLTNRMKDFDSDCDPGINYELYALKNQCKVLIDKIDEYDKVRLNISGKYN
jgi:hypothetical protein